MSKKSNSGNSFLWFLSGILAGGITGILYAPDKGSSTRKKLSFKLSKYKELLEGFIEDVLQEKDTPLTKELKSRGENVILATKNKAEQLLEDVDDLLSQIKKT